MSNIRPAFNLLWLSDNRDNIFKMLKNFPTFGTKFLNFKQTFLQQIQYLWQSGQCYPIGSNKTSQIQLNPAKFSRVWMTQCCLTFIHCAVLNVSNHTNYSVLQNIVINYPCPQHSPRAYIKYKQLIKKLKSWGGQSWWVMDSGLPTGVGGQSWHSPCDLANNFLGSMFSITSPWYFLSSPKLSLVPTVIYR